MGRLGILAYLRHFLLLAGQIADRIGPRTTFICGTFTLNWTNILSAFATNTNALSAGRALAGVGAAVVSYLPIRGC